MNFQILPNPLFAYDLFDQKEFLALYGVKQNPVYHPEGDALTHTLAVVAAAQDIAERDGLNEEDTFVLLLAAICHDLGKATTTILVDGVYKSPGHDVAGEAPTRSLLGRIGLPERLVERVVCLVREHMVHTYLPKGVDPPKRVAGRLLDRIEGFTTIEELGRLVEADKSGRPPLPKEKPDTYTRLAKVAKLVLEDRAAEALLPAPLLTGKDILENFKVEPGPIVGELLRVARLRQSMAPEDTKEQIIATLKQVFEGIY